MVVRDIVGSLFEGLPGVAHGDGEEGLFEHGDVVESVPEYDGVLRLSATQASMRRMPRRLSVGSMSTYGRYIPSAADRMNRVHRLFSPAGRT